MTKTTDGLRARLRAFRQRHLFCTPREARCAVAVAQQMKVQELEQERARLLRAAADLVSVRTHFRRSAKVYALSVEVDEAAFLAGEDAGYEAVAREAAASVARRRALERTTPAPPPGTPPAPGKPRTERVGACTGGCGGVPDT